MTYADYQDKLNKSVWQLLPKASEILSGDPDFLVEEASGTFDLTMGEIGELCELVRQVITKELPVEKFEASLKEKLDEDNAPRAGEIVSAVNEKIFVKLLPALGITPLPITITKDTAADVNVEFKEEEKKEEGMAAKYLDPSSPVIINKIKIFQPTSPATFPKPTNPFGNLRTSGPFENLRTSGTPKRPDSSSRASFPTYKPVPIVPQPLSEFAPSRASSPLSNSGSSVKTSPYPSSATSSESPVKTSPYPSSATSSGSPLSTAPTSQLQNFKTNLSEPSHEQLSENPTDSFLKMLSDKLSEEELQSRFDKLPYALKTALRSVDSARKVVDIGRKYALHVDKLGELGEETALVILGITHPAEFLPHLVRRLGMSEKEIRPLAQEINTEVFLKIREALKQINGEPVQGLQVPPGMRSVREPQVPPGMRPIREPQDLRPIREPQDLRPVETTTTQTTSEPLPADAGEEFAKETTEMPSPIEPNVVQEEAGEILNREAILKDIENPTEATDALRPKIPEPSVHSTTSVPAASIAPISPIPMETSPSLSSNSESMVNTPPTKTPETFTQSVVKSETVEEKAPETPASNVVETGTPKTDTPQSIMEQKLSAATTSSKTESQYKGDPYREPIE